MWNVENVPNSSCYGKCSLARTFPLFSRSEFDTLLYFRNLEDPQDCDLSTSSRGCKGKKGKHKESAYTGNPLSPKMGGNGKRGTCNTYSPPWTSTILNDFRGVNASRKRTDWKRGKGYLDIFWNCLTFKTDILLNWFCMFISDKAVWNSLKLPFDNFNVRFYWFLTPFDQYVVLAFADTWPWMSLKSPWMYETWSECSLSCLLKLLKWDTFFQVDVWVVRNVSLLYIPNTGRLVRIKCD